MTDPDYLRRYRMYTCMVNSMARSSDSEDRSEGSLDGHSSLDGNSPGMTDTAAAAADPDDFARSDTEYSNRNTDGGSDSEDSLTSTESSYYSGFSSSEDENLEFGEELAQWATRHKCTRASVNEILNLLRKQGHRLPKDARTLLQTPKIVEIVEKCGGSYAYFGIETGLLKVIARYPNLFRTNDANLIFNIDGIPLFKSSSTQIWPILCSVNNFEPFIVAIFYGESKPDSVEDYLADFLEEIPALKHNGFDYNERTVNVKITAIVCDAPARAFLKCIKGHTGFYSCERCTIRGQRRNNRTVFNISEVLSPDRTCEQFDNLAYLHTHQLKQSPLIGVGIDCVNGFPLDYMHLVCLGAVKRILMFLKDGPRECRLSRNQIDIISDKLVSLNGKLPNDFARQPRSLKHLDRWKATEYRQFLLYTGPLVLRDVVNESVYKHFLSLTVALSVLLDTNNTTRNAYLDYAKELLIYFVRKGKSVYGETFTTYNVHSLIHLCDDVRNFQVSLNDISAFQFENHLQQVKKSVKAAKNPVSQIVKRATEKENSKIKYIHKRKFHHVSTKKKDNCFLTKNQRFAFVREKRHDRKYVCDVLNMQHVHSFFDNPCDSKLVNIGVARNFITLMRRQLLDHYDFERKVVCLPFDRGYLLLPMLHEVERQ